MSLALQVDQILAVLLADGWHMVAKQSFSLDSYEYLWDEQILQGGGGHGLCAIGFEFLECTPLGNMTIAGPLSAILAVRHDRTLKLKRPS